MDRKRSALMGWLLRTVSAHVVGLFSLFVLFLVVIRRVEQELRETGGVAPRYLEKLFRVSRSLGDWWIVIPFAVLIFVIVDCAVYSFLSRRFGRRGASAWWWGVLGGVLAVVLVVVGLVVRGVRAAAGM